MRSLQYERELEKHTTEFEYIEAWPLARIDQEKSEANQARMGLVINENRVTVYAGWYADPRYQNFPPLVGRKASKAADAKLILIDGNQRSTAARRAGRKTHDIYLITSQDPQVITKILATFNAAISCWEPSFADKIAHAIRLIEIGQSQDQAAQNAGVTKPQLADEVVDIRVVAALRSNGIITGSTINGALTPSNRNKIHSLYLLDEELMCQMALAIVDAGLVGKEVSEQIKKIKAERTPAARLEVIKNMREEVWFKKRVADRSGSNKEPKKMTIRNQLLRLVRSVRTLMGAHMGKDHETFHVDAEEIRDFHTSSKKQPSISEIMARLKIILKVED